MNEKSVDSELTTSPSEVPAAEVPTFRPVVEAPLVSTPTGDRSRPSITGEEENRTPTCDDAPEKNTTDGAIPANSQCSICLDDVAEGGTKPYKTDCGHVFHRECLVQWRARSKKSCPLCRETLRRGLTPKGHVSPPGQQVRPPEGDTVADAIRAAARRSRTAHRLRLNVNARIREQLADQAQRALEQQRREQLSQLTETQSQLMSSETFTSNEF